MTRRALSTIALAIALIVLVMVFSRPIQDSHENEIAPPTQMEEYTPRSDEPEPVTPVAPEKSQPVTQQSAELVESDVPSEVNWPDGIEGLLLDYFAQQKNFEFTSISSVKCDEHHCEIIFTGTDPNPLIVDAYSALQSGFYGPPFYAKQGSLGTREIAPGARVFVITLSNVPYQEPGTEN